MKVSLLNCKHCGRNTSSFCTVCQEPVCKKCAEWPDDDTCQDCGVGSVKKETETDDDDK